MNIILESINRFVWGVPASIMIIGVGIYLSFCTGMVQVTMLGKAWRLFLRKLTQRKEDDAGVSSYQALCTALAATVGTGNIAGVAGAIAIGGPGAIFWMWVCGLLGMVTKYAEATLAVRYRIKSKNGEYLGGPMYMIQNGMSDQWKWLAGIYCFFGVVAAFGVGNATQINAVVDAINSIATALGGKETAMGNAMIGVGFGILVAMMLSGGARGIASITERLVPVAAVFYMLLCSFILVLRVEAIPTAISSIFKGAFAPSAITGGMIGSALTALRIGAARGVFTNEAGMGTAAIAHGLANVHHPAEQGLMGIMEVFLDTIVICTMTALVILCSGVPIPYGTDTGMELTTQAFAQVLGDWVCIPIGLALCCFAIATILGWSMYGARCAQYLFGEKSWKRFVALQAGTVILGAIMNTGMIWLLAETVNGLMAIPNLIALAALSPELVKLTNQYLSENSSRVKQTVHNRQLTDILQTMHRRCDK